MAIKTFAVGEVLTAANTNTYLANSVANVITPTSVTNATLSGAKITLGTGVASATVNGVFSSSYDVYIVQGYGITASVAASVLFMTINGSAGSTYQACGYYMAYGSTTINGIGGAAAATGFRLGENAADSSNSFKAVLYRPGLATATSYESTAQNNAYIARYQGKDTNAAASVNFTLAPSSGTLTGGTVMVYGVRIG